MTAVAPKNAKHLDETGFILCLGNRGFSLRFDEEEIANAPGHLVALTESLESLSRLARDDDERLDTDEIRHCIAAIELLSGLAHQISKKYAQAEGEG